MDFGDVAATDSEFGRSSGRVVLTVRPSIGSVKVAVTVMELSVIDASLNHDAFVATACEVDVMEIGVGVRLTLFALNANLSVRSYRPLTFAVTVSPAIAVDGEKDKDKSGAEKRALTSIAETVPLLYPVPLLVM